jgi:hypothetical protein
MTRSMRVLLGFAVGLVGPSLAEAPTTPARPSPATENVTIAQADSRPVHIEHELVVIRVTSALPRRTANTASARPALRGRKPSVALARDERRGAPLVRAARAFVGDGRYRPEPFPRPGR